MVLLNIAPVDIYVGAATVTTSVGMKLSPGAAELLVSEAGTDLAILQQELSKLLQFTKGGKDPVTADEGIRVDTSLEKLAKLKAVFRADGTVTAGNSSPLNDGAAALCLASEEGLKALGATLLLL